jgi:hypothetical protein
MRSVKETREYRAQAIAQAHFVGMKKADLYHAQGDSGYDFLLTNPSKPENCVGIEVKATKQPRSALLKQFETFRRRLGKSPIPTVVMFIDYDDYNGYYAVIGRNSRGLEPLTRNDLQKDLSELLKLKAASKTKRLAKNPAHTKTKAPRK